MWTVVLRCRDGRTGQGLLTDWVWRPRERGETMGLQHIFQTWLGAVIRGSCVHMGHTYGYFLKCSLRPGRLVFP